MLLLVPEPLTASGEWLAGMALPDQLLQAPQAVFNALMMSYAVQIWARKHFFSALIARWRIPSLLVFLASSFVVFWRPSLALFLELIGFGEFLSVCSCADEHLLYSA